MFAPLISIFSIVWLLSRHHLTWGVGARRVSNIVDVSMFSPERPIDGLLSSFLQDDISLIEDRLTLTVGSKFLHTRYTGLETQPNARLLFGSAEPPSSPWTFLPGPSAPRPAAIVTSTCPS